MLKIKICCAPLNIAKSCGADCHAETGLYYKWCHWSVLLWLSGQLLSFFSNRFAMDSPVASLPLIAPQPGFICGTVPVPTAPEGQSKELIIVPASSMKVVSDR